MLVREFFIIFLIALFSEPVLAGVYVMGDAGMGSSPNGIGAAIGYRGQAGDFAIGSGNTKNGVASFPISLDWRKPLSSQQAVINPIGNFNLQWGLGISGYKGRGKRSTVFERKGVGSHGNGVYKTDVSWEFLYGRVAVGGVVEDIISKNSFFLLEGGVSDTLYSKVTADSPDGDGSNLGRPIGLDVYDGYYGRYNYGYMGPNDKGVYVRLGLGWSL